MVRYECITGIALNWQTGIVEQCQAWYQIEPLPGGLCSVQRLPGIAWSGPVVIAASNAPCLKNKGRFL